MSHPLKNYTLGKGLQVMLRIYICPQCYNFRMVSRKLDAICFHCGTKLMRCDVEYVDYMEMSEKERNGYRERFIERMKQYRGKIDEVHIEQTNKMEEVHIEQTNK